MEKKKTTAFGKDVYLLGKDADGVMYWLQAAQWECDWYWGGVYVRTYTKNEYPERSKDIRSHNHFDSMFFNGRKHGKDAFYEFFQEHPFTESEVWTICELIKSFYIAKNYSEMIYRGGTHYTTNPAKDVIKSQDEYERINKSVIPAIMEELYRILAG